ncbi:MAG: sigma-54 dependent transcriptional regulator [Deltaproteobacteria bacterium]|nr:sigma-54 dependent transcriptional regulator [Deltaproteobacteria bacterium]
MRGHILVVDDEPGIRETLAGIFEDEGYRVSLADSARAALRIVEDVHPDLVLLDIWMPGMDGLEALPRIKELRPDLPVIMISGHGTVETAVKAIRMGAYDFIEKPLSLDQVLITAQHVLDLQRLRVENELLRNAIERRYEIVGESAPMQLLKEQVRLAAPTESRVLITGENGTGKELVARQIHMLSPRRDKPFIEVNCAAIPEDLIESELFGHEKGAFTGAAGRKKGKFDVADGGTIFLDEIADMSLRTQAKVLRILQEQKFERVGGTESVTVDVRVIAATNKDLETMIRDGRFREDLYFRLNVLPLHVPPLRERQGDIPPLIEFFLDQYAVTSGMARKSIDPDAVDLMRRYPWPGNVRELKNIVERLMIMTAGNVVRPENVRMTLKLDRNADEPDAEDILMRDSWKEAKADFERAFLLKKLQEFDGNISKTAESIGVERTHLHRRIKALGIDFDDV